MRSYSLSATLIILLMKLNCVSAQDARHDSLTHFNYTILAGSKVTVFGSTNVNEFSCFSEETWENPGPELICSAPVTKADFKNAVIKIRTQSLDCGNELMNNNLYTTMKSDQSPYIVIELAEVNSMNAQPIHLNVKSILSAEVYITLAGKRLLNTMVVNESNPAQGIYHFTGSHRILLSDYGIVPPRAFFGLIKVNDATTVEFDLTVSVQQQPSP